MSDHAVQVCPDLDRECGDREVNWCATCPKRAGGGELPKPLCYVFNHVEQDLRGERMITAGLWNAPTGQSGLALFTESQLIAHAAKCVAEERAKHTALVKAAEWNERIRASVDSLLEQAGFSVDCSVRHQLFLMNFDEVQK